MMKNCLFIALGVLLSSQAFAFKLTPMVIRFAPTGNKATQVLILENNGGEKIPVQIEVFTRGIDAKGEEVREKTSDFALYPEQVVLLPNEKRNVRVTFTSSLKGSDEQAYRIVATQLPVEFKQQNAKAKKPGVSLNFLLQYVASAYVAPEGAAPKTKLKDIKSNDGKKVQITLLNEGSAHEVLRPKSLKIYSATKLVYETTQLKELEGANLLAKTQKTFTVSLPKEIPNKDLKADLELGEPLD